MHINLLMPLTPCLPQPPSDDLTVADANSAWLARRYRLQPAYAAALKDAFGTAAQPLTGAQVRRRLLRWGPVPAAVGVAPVCAALWCAGMALLSLLA